MITKTITRTRMKELISSTNKWAIENTSNNGEAQRREYVTNDNDVRLIAVESFSRLRYFYGIIIKTNGFSDIRFRCETKRKISINS